MSCSITQFFANAVARSCDRVCVPIQDHIDECEQRLAACDPAAFAISYDVQIDLCALLFTTHTEQLAVRGGSVEAIVEIRHTRRQQLHL